MTYNIVIVGGSFAGRMIAQGLIDLDNSSFSITIIDKSDHFEFICSNYKTTTDNSAFEYNSVPQQKAIKSLGDTQNRIRFIHGSLQKVNHNNNSVTVIDAKDQTMEVKYHAVVLCTGQQYGSPWRDGNGNHGQSITHYLDRRLQSQNYIKKVARSTSVLVVGGGSIAISTVGNLIETYKKLGVKVGLCYQGPILCPSIHGAHQSILTHLEQIGVDVHLEHKFSDSTLGELGYEMSIDCTGYSFKAPRIFMQDELAACLEPATGQIMVNKYCQVTNVHPVVDLPEIQPQVVRTYGNIFSFGDVCKTPSNEHKSIHSMHQYKEQVCNNIIAAVKADKNMKMLEIPKEFHFYQFFPIDSKFGILASNNHWELSQNVPKQKEDFEEQLLKEIRNDPKAKEQAKSDYFSMKVVNYIYSSIFCGFLPCSISKRRQHNLDQIQKSKERILKMMREAK